MSYKAEYSQKARKVLKKLDHQIADKIVRYIHEIELLDDPFSRGHGLVENKKGIWRYRVEDWRILCEIKENILIIHVIDIGNRREIYKQ
ncbi:MAG: type II toxin-antitoxin system RelE/ParE family toxin [Treponema sp.]|nr:type II toxin-antitoxin system RelE/ParE family toxin [Treponema sp.]